MDIIEKVKEAISGILTSKEVELVDLSYRRRKEGMVLTFLVDKLGGITLDQCGQLSGQLDQLLDETDIINEPYVLEVSSPGLDRPLKTKNDFIRSLGKLVKISAGVEIDGKQTHLGKLCGVNKEGVVIINRSKQSTIIPFSDIVKARLEIKF